MNKGTIVKVAAIAAALVGVSVGSAAAASQITANGLATGAANHRVIANGSVHQGDLAPGVKGLLHRVGAKGDPGSNGTDGKNGVFGAYYAVAYYDLGDTNAGAIATVACSSESDVAISGGVQTIGAGGTSAAVGDSFPGRMDWSTNTPRANRLDGWIVQFDANHAPLKEKIWALCLPGQDVPVVNTYTESAG